MSTGKPPKLLICLLAHKLFTIKRKIWQKNAIVYCLHSDIFNMIWKRFYSAMLLTLYMTSHDCLYYLRQGGNVFAGFCLSVCLSVCQQDNSKSYERIFLKFWEYVGHGINYQWFNFGRDPAGILDYFEIFVTIALKGA